LVFNSYIDYMIGGTIEAGTSIVVLKLEDGLWCLAYEGSLHPNVLKLRCMEVRSHLPRGLKMPTPKPAPKASRQEIAESIYKAQYHYLNDKHWDISSEIQEAVESAFGVWLQANTADFNERMEKAVSHELDRKVAHWLEVNREDLLNRIAEKVASRLAGGDPEKA
jgi:hypothetical protein